MLFRATRTRFYLPSVLFAFCFATTALSQVRILRVLQHSNVVGIYQFFKDDPDYYYMVLEYMSGGELFDRIVQKVLQSNNPWRSEEQRSSEPLSA